MDEKGLFRRSIQNNQILPSTTNISAIKVTPPTIAPSATKSSSPYTIAGILSIMEAHGLRKLRHGNYNGSGKRALVCSVVAFCIIGLMFHMSRSSSPISSLSSACLQKQDQTWHGGHPASHKSGSCWCGGEDGYCMCTPAVAIDIVLYSKRKGSDNDEYDVWAVRREDTGQLATIGGFVDLGETTEHAVLREVEEETGIIIPAHLINNKNSAMKLVGIYSDPRRDNRRHIVSVAYALEFRPDIMTTKDGSNVPKAGDDAKEVVAVPLRDIGVKYKGEDWYADHLSILLDFKEQAMMGEGKQGGSDLEKERGGELYKDIARSTCQ